MSQAGSSPDIDISQYTTQQIVEAIQFLIRTRENGAKRKREWAARQRSLKEQQPAAE